MARRPIKAARVHRIEASENSADDAWVAPAIFLVALLIRLIHLWQLHSTPLVTVLTGDSRAYDEWAQRISQGDWLGNTVFYQAPLYPYVLGVIYTVAGRHLFDVRIFQAVMGATACMLLGLAAWNFFSRRVGLIAGLMLALYAPAIFFDSLIQKSFLDLFFICLMLWLMSRLSTADQPRPRDWFLTGLALGALSLTRENSLVFIAIVLLWAVMRGWRTPKRHLQPSAMFVLGVSLVLVPVALRNRIVGGEFHLTTAQFGPNFYIGNNPAATGAYTALREGRGTAEYEREDATSIAERATGRTLTPAEVSSFWTNQAFTFIRSQPKAWLRLLGTKFGLLWNATELMDTESQDSYAEWSIPLRLLGRVGHFGILVPLALFGACITWRDRSRLWVLYAMVAAYAGSVLMFYVFARYRYPLVPFLILFAAAGVSGAARFIRGTPLPQVIMALAVVGLVGITVNKPLVPAGLTRAITESNLGQALQEEGRYEEAIAHYQRAIAFKPDWAPAYNNMGTALRAQGRIDDAIEHFHRALSLQPGYPRAHYNLGVALLAAGKPEEAIDQLRLALPAMGDLLDTRKNLGIALAAIGRTDEAIAEFREAVRLDPGAAEVQRALGEALASKEQWPEAADHFRRAVQLNPDDGQAHVDLSTLLLNLHQFDESAAESRASLRLKPNSVEAHNNLGVALASQGKLNEAIEEFQEAVRLKPDFADARNNLETARRLRKGRRN